MAKIRCAPERAWLYCGIIYGVFHIMLPECAGLVPSLLGRWQSFNERSGQLRAIIEVQAETDGYKAVIRRLFTAPAESRNPICVHCRDERRGKPIEGMTIIRGLKHQSARIWTGGEILNPEDGNTYECNAELSEDGKELRVRAYRKIVMFGKTQVWRRENDERNTFIEIRLDSPIGDRCA